MNADLKQLTVELSGDLALVDAEIRSALDSPVETISNIATYLINGGGKRFRPMLLLLSSGAFGYKGTRAHGIAACLEFVHTATLLHDDVVDSAELRRGQASANMLWGNEATVLVGDFLYARAFLKLVKDGDLAVLESVSRSTTRMAEGEILQLMSICKPDTTEADYLRVVEGKTAVLFSSASEIGAILGNAPDAVRKKMAEFGLSIGIAFQIADDTIDYLESDETMGKAQGQDYYDGKVTLPFIAARRILDDAGRKELDELMQKEGKTRDDFGRLFSIIKGCGAFEISFETARGYVETAKKQIEDIPMPFRSKLSAVADFTIARHA